MQHKRWRSLWAGWFSLIVMSAGADEKFSSALTESIEKHKHVLAQWAANPKIIEAVKTSNAHGETGMIPGMSNSKWNLLEDDDPLAKQFKENPAGQLVLEWEQKYPNDLSKIYIRDKNGNLVASSRNKALLYNNRSKPPFENAMKGQLWSASEIKPDPGSQVPGVHISVPVLDNGVPIGIIHSSVIAK